MLIRLFKQTFHNFKLFKPKYQFAVSLPSFKPYQLNSTLLSALEHNNITTPSSIQDLTIPILKQNNKQCKIYYIASQTGSGKTLAYLLPIFDQLKQQEIEIGTQLTKPNRPRCIILVSSKELCMQIELEAKKLAHFVKLKVFSCHNLKPFKREKMMLDNGIDVMITTLERLQKHIEKNNFYWSNISYFVVEEADTQFEMGFSEIIGKWVNTVFKRAELRENLQEQQPNICFVSATFTGQLNRFFNNIGEEKIKKIIDDKTHLNLENLKHEFVHCKTYDKIEPSLQVIKNMLVTIQKTKEDNLGGLLIFCNSIPSLHSLEHALNDNALQCVSLHSDVPKKLRLQNYTRFKNQDVDIMLATDLGSRGLDFPFLTHVLNYDFPRTTSDYLHRAGRAGRAGRQGFVYSLYRNNDLLLINQLQESNQNQSPLKIQGSQYQMINREILKNFKQQEKEGGRKYGQSKQLLQQQNLKYLQYIPQEYGGGGRSIQKKPDYRKMSESVPNITKDQQNLLKKYKPQVDKYTKTYKSLESKVRNMKKWQRVQMMNRVRTMKLSIKTNKKRSFHFKKYKLKMNRRRNKSLEQNIKM